MVNTVTVAIIFTDFIITSYMAIQGCSQNYIKGVLNSAGFCSVDTDLLTKHLVTKENVCHPVYDYSHYTVKIKSFTSYVCIVAY